MPTRSFRQFVLYSVIALFFCAFASAKEYRSHQWNGDILKVKTDVGTLVFDPVSNSSIAAHFFKPNGDVMPSFALSESHNGDAKADFKALRSELVLSLPELTLRVAKSPFSISYYRDDELLTKHESGFFQYEGVRGVRFELDESEKLYGGGQRVLGMNRRGHKLPLYHKTHYGYTSESKQMYFGLSAVMSSKHYALVFDNSARGAMDLGAAQSNVLQFEAIAGRNGYLITSGQSLPGLVSNFTEVTGRQPLPPRWSLGHLSSRFGYRTEQEVRDVVAKYQALDFPLDAMILDLYWFGKDIKGHMGNLDWDRETFPNAEKMMQDLKGQGVETVVITEPFILKTSKNWNSVVEANALAMNLSGQTPRVFDMFFGTAGLVDVFSESGQHWFWRKYKHILNTGVSGIWGDLGEPEVHPSDTLHAIGSANEVHNAYGHQWAKLIHDNFSQDFPDRRLFLLMRSGFVGSQRYGVMPWTGDVSRSWGGLKPQVELSLQMGLFGLGYTHSDLGGFSASDTFDAQMYTRWMQFGTFSPIYRPHAHDSIAPEPIFHDKQTQDVVREFIKLRYQMLPYNYTLAHQNTTTGLPFMRPVSFAEPDDAALFDTKDSFLWGGDFFVHPVTDPDVSAISTYLPKGYWFNFWNDEVVLGGEQISVAVDINTIPVFVRAGSIIPFAQPMKTTAAFNNETIDLHYYHHASVNRASGQWFDDDGQSASSIANEQYRLFDFAVERTDRSFTVSISHTGKGYKEMPENLSFNLHIHGLDVQEFSTQSGVELTPGEGITLVWQGEPVSFTFTQQ